MCFCLHTYGFHDDWLSIYTWIRTEHLVWIWMNSIVRMVSLFVEWHIHILFTVNARIVSNFCFQNYILHIWIDLNLNFILDLIDLKGIILMPMHCIYNTLKTLKIHFLLLLSFRILFFFFCVFSLKKQSKWSLTYFFKSQLTLITC